MIVPGCQNEGLLGEWHSVEKECRIEWAVFIHIDELLGSNGDDSSGKFPRFFKIDLRGVSKFFNGELGTKSSEKVTIFFLFTGDDETKGGGSGAAFFSDDLIGDRFNSSDARRISAAPEEPAIFLRFVFRSGDPSSSSSSLPSSTM